MEKQALPLANAEELHASGMRLLEQAREIIARDGENADSMAEIGKLLKEITASGVFDPLLAIRPGGKSAAVDVIAEHDDGSNLSFYAMQDWRSPPTSDVHWHNYWQVLLCVEGSWPDTIWKPVGEIVDGSARDIAVDRHETVGEGMLQALGPAEPHGWLADNVRHAEKATLLMWSGSARGLPRTDLDIDSGRLTEEFDFLNPRPGERKLASTASWVRY